MKQKIFENITKEPVYKLNLALIEAGLTWTEILNLWDNSIKNAKKDND